MDANTLPRVSLKKPSRDTISINSVPYGVQLNVEATVGTAQEIEPHTIREITPKHISEEVIPAQAITSDTPSVKRVGSNKKSKKPKPNASPTKVSNENDSRSIVFTYNTAKMLVDILDNEACEDFFGDNAVSPHVGADNRVYCKMRRKRNLFDARSSVIDNLQCLLEILALPDTDFYAVFEFIERCSKSGFAPKQFYNDMLELLTLMYKNNEDAVINCLEDETYWATGSRLSSLLIDLTYCSDMTDRPTALQVMSRYIFRQLEYILKRETCFTVSPLYTFVCMNMCAEDVKFDTIYPESADRHLARLRGTLQAYGRACHLTRPTDTFKVCSETPHIISDIGCIEDETAIMISCIGSALGLFTLLGLGMYGTLTLLFAVGCTALAAISWLFFATKKICEKVDNTRERRRVLGYRALGLYRACNLYPSLSPLVESRLPKLLLRS